MITAQSNPTRYAVAAGLFLLGCAVFAVVYCQAPLYYSNQNQYFLHGHARAGSGLLADDWLASTADPTPVFSTLVASTVRYAHPWCFYAFHALLLGAYGGAALGLFVAMTRVADVPPHPLPLSPQVQGESGEKPGRWPVFLALFVLLHSGLIRWLSYQTLGFDYPWFFQSGLAGQYTLGAMLQPSMFGVLLLVAVWLFVIERPLLAVACIGLCITFHSTYLLAGAFLTLGFMWSLVGEKRWRLALGVGALALVLVLPTVVSILVRFQPTSPKVFSAAQDILANFRIPHHTRPDLWLDWVAGLQIAWVGVAILLVRGGRLYPVLGVPFLLGVVFTLIQVITGNTTLALLFPWRISAILVPLATVIILTRLVAIRSLPLGTRPAMIASTILVVFLASAGIAIQATRSAFNSGDEEMKMLAWVRANKQPGDVYFLPITVPNTAKTTRGSLSSDFMPLALKRRNTQIIPIDLQRFRLHAETPIYVDFKSIPYLDTDVIEWRERLRRTQEINDRFAKEDAAEAVSALRQLGVTHVVRPVSKALPVEGVRQVYGDEVYAVYAIGGE